MACISHGSFTYSLVDGHQVSFWFFCFIISFGCTGSPLLSAGFLSLSWVGATLLEVCGISSCIAQVLGLRASVVTAHRLRSCGSRALGHRLRSCSTAYGIFLDQGLNPCPLHWYVDSYLLHHQGSPVSRLGLLQIKLHEYLCTGFR